MLVEGAIRLSAHLIGGDHGQFVSQVLGGCYPYENLPAIGKIADRPPRCPNSMWLRPLWPAFEDLKRQGVR